MSQFKSDISFDNGYIFGDVARFVAKVAGFSGVLIMLGRVEFIFMGLFLLLFPLFIFTSKQGTEISISKNSLREYRSYFGFKSGKWISSENFPDMTILRIGRSRNLMNFAGAVRDKIDESKNEIYLLTADHRKRILIRVCQSDNEGGLFAKELAEKMGKKLVAFNPKISEQTKARRFAKGQE